MGFAILLWILDNLSALLFSKEHKNPQRGLPKNLMSILVEENEYYQLQSRITAFKASLSFGSSNEIKLTSRDINLSLRNMYSRNFEQKFHERAFDRVEIFDIEQGEIVAKEFLSFLLLDIQPICVSKKTIKFELQNGEILELQMQSHGIAGHDVEPRYTPISNEFSSNLIYRILSSSTLDSAERCSVGSPRIQSRTIAAPLVCNLKQICVINDELILRS
ncbi:hypothetical protein [Leptolyngbya sp. GGD]|uniref:hypothetical protein n=1 Tax=Leptolyngbya sp. GGD TaxID=2997907 RepID=UPI00227A6C04|nr:hypothetical protein [Leptolyngbya sp. GGD]MCY6493934.1 hypothetical protein [Leptolyngbya sp. GGD]